MAIDLQKEVETLKSALRVRETELRSTEQKLEYAKGRIAHLTDLMTGEWTAQSHLRNLQSCYFSIGDQNGRIGMTP